MHKQTFKNIPNSNSVIVFIHGFTESPNFFNFLNQIAIKEGYSYLNILLPGHGKSSLDFCLNGYRAWTKHIDKELDKLKSRYENIILVGHSMGCLLSINAYLKNKYNIKGIFCLNIPLNIRMDFKTFLSSMNILFAPSKIKDDYTKFILNRSSISNRKFYLYPFWIPRYIDLFYLSFKTYFNIKNIKIPIVYLQSYKDGLVSIQSAITLKRLLKRHKIKNNTVIVLKKSDHYIYKDDDYKIVVNSFVCFLRKYINKDKKAISLN